MITLIWAEDDKHGIAKNQKIPWYVKEDLEMFKQLTTNKIVVMGYNTFLSLGRPLPNRQNIVISANHEVLNENVRVYKNIDDLLKVVGNREIYIIGGRQIYKQFLPLADRLIISRIIGDFQCDLFMDFIDFSNFNFIGRKHMDSFSVEIYDKKF